MSNPFKLIQETNPPIESENKPWYGKGLNFKCTECGQCCTGAPGYTWVSDDEAIAIADYLKISLDEFGKRYVKRVGDRLSLREDARNYDCIFLKDKKCQIYPVRPTQCRTYPWWPQHIKSKEEWERAAQFCEGIQCEAPIVPQHKIEEQALLQEKWEKHLGDRMQSYL